MRGWIDATYQNDELQKNMLRSLQLLHGQGVSQANEDMDEIVDAMLPGQHRREGQRAVAEVREGDLRPAEHLEVTVTAADT